MAVVAAPGPLLVGREQELAELWSALVDARTGHGRLVLLAGEAGIGKTRLLEALAQAAHPIEVRMHWGRCWEGGGAPPYWPWLQLIEACADGIDPATLERWLGRGAPDVTQMVPRMATLLPGLIPTRPSESPDTRLRLFDSVTSFLYNAAADGGLVIALDDVHAADEASLRLLEHVAKEIGGSHLLCLATYRNAEAASEPKLGRRIRTIASLGSLIRLWGLDQCSVATLLEDNGLRGVTADLAREVCATTGGNPFFVHEVARLLQAEGRGKRATIPTEIRAAAGRRLSQVSEPTRQLLRKAAVLGREFDLRSLAGLTGTAEERVLDALGEAADRDVVEVRGLRRWAFSHPLLRETLYAEIADDDRAALHVRAAVALEASDADGGEPDLPTLAYHFRQSGPAGDAAKAAQYCQRAADTAMASLAFEDAVALLGHALDATEASTTGDGRRQRYEVLVRLGEANSRLGDFAAAREAFGRAVQMARALHAPELLARAAVGMGQRGGNVVDEACVAALEEALAALPAGDSSLRAQVLICLAESQKRLDARWDVVRAFADEGLALARRTGDAETLRLALWQWHHTYGQSPALSDRLAVINELVQLAEEAGDPEQLIVARHWRAYDLWESGDIRASLADLDANLADAEGLRLPFLMWVATFAQCIPSELEGKLDDAEAWALRAREIGERTGFGYVEHVFDSFLQGIRGLQGRFEEAEAIARNNIRRYGQRGVVDCFPVGAAICLAERGCDEEARRELEVMLADGLAPEAFGPPRSCCTAGLAELCWLLDHANHAERLYSMLLPFAGQNLRGGGSCEVPLGLLATLLQRWDEAEAHFERGHRRHRDMGAVLFDARARMAHGSMLLRRGGPDDAERATALFTSARDTFRSLGLELFEARAAEQLRLVSGGGDGLFRLDGAHWVVRYEGTTVRLDDTKGLRYLAHLLGHPGSKVHAADLLSLAGGHNAELDPERARQRVARAIRTSVDRITAVHPALGRHLQATVHPGLVSMYLPDARRPVMWRA